MELTLIIGGRIVRASDVTESQLERLIANLRSEGLSVSISDAEYGGKVIRTEKTAR